MNRVQLMDCTLRDGAYLLDKKVPPAMFNNVIELLDRAGVEYIEIGFLQDGNYSDEFNIFATCNAASKRIKSIPISCNLCLLADYSRFSVRNLDYAYQSNISMIRATFFPHEIAYIAEYCNSIRSMGYKVSVQLIDFSSYDISTFNKIIEIVNNLRPEVLTLVDTYGSIFFDEAVPIFRLVDSHLNKDIQIGFHSHNNLQMAVPLTIQLLKEINNRDIIIDGTLRGLGRGAGNAPTEILAYYLNKMHSRHYDIIMIMQIIESYIEEYKSLYGYTPLHFVSGMGCAHVNTASYLRDKGISPSEQINILSSLDGYVKKRYVYEELDRIINGD